MDPGKIMPSLPDFQGPVSNRFIMPFVLLCEVLVKHYRHRLSLFTN